MSPVGEPGEVGRPAQYDVVIVGAGPAGLTAAIYNRRSLLSTLIIEKKVPGGLLNETEHIENFPGFAETIRATDLVEAMTSQARRLGAAIVPDEVMGIAAGAGRIEVRGAVTSYSGHTVILATGSHPRKLPVDGAEQWIGRGLSYCATCDGFFFRDARLLVVGAGDSALTEAIYLTRFARSVGIVVRHPEDDPHALRATPALVEEARRESKIHFVWNARIDALQGDAKLTAVTLSDLGTGERRDEPVDGVFVSIGHLPATEFARGVVDLDKDGYIVTDDRRRTNLDGVFAAGDVRAQSREYAQAVVAASDGAIAAIEAERYLARLARTAPRSSP